MSLILWSFVVLIICFGASYLAEKSNRSKSSLTTLLGTAISSLFLMLVLWIIYIIPTENPVGEWLDSLKIIGLIASGCLAWSLGGIFCKFRHNNHVSGELIETKEKQD